VFLVVPVFATLLAIGTGFLWWRYGRRAHVGVERMRGKWLMWSSLVFAAFLIITTLTLAFDNEGGDPPSWRQVISPADTLR
jgi:hypothetical protein